MTKLVTILSPSELTEKKNQLGADTQLFWLGGSPRLRRQTEIVTGLKFNTEAQFAGLFHQIFCKHSSDLLDVYAQFQTENQSPGFWQTSIASKSSASEPVVRSLVLLLCAARLVTASTKKTVIVVESPALGHCLSSVFDPKRTWYWRRRWYFMKFRLLAKMLVKHFVFVLQAATLRINAVMDGGLRVTKSERRHLAYLCELGLRRASCVLLMEKPYSRIETLAVCVITFQSTVWKSGCCQCFLTLAAQSEAN